MFSLKNASIIIDSLRSVEHMKLNEGYDIEYNFKKLLYHGHNRTVELFNVVQFAW